MLSDLRGLMAVAVFGTSFLFIHVFSVFLTFLRHSPKCFHALLIDFKLSIAVKL